MDSSNSEAAVASTTLFLYLKAVYQSCAVSKGSREQTRDCRWGCEGRGNQKSGDSSGEQMSGYLSSLSISLSLMLKEWDIYVLFSPDSLLSA